MLTHGLVPSRRLIVLLCAPWMLMGAVCVSGCSTDQGKVTRKTVGLQQIRDLGTQPTLNDVAQMLGGIPLTQMPYFEYPATEGGIYVFSFIPTNEVLGPSADGSSDRLPLVAVMKADAHDAFMRKEGWYVFPITFAGKRWTGFPEPDKDVRSDCR